MSLEQKTQHYPRVKNYRTRTYFLIWQDCKCVISLLLFPNYSNQKDAHFL